jgi:anti-sigma factor RsiW
MNCTDFDRMADPLVDGELAEAERAEAEAHLTSCSTCQRQVGGLRALKGAVKRSAERAAPHHLREALRARVRQEPVMVRLRPSRRNAPAYAAAAAAMAAATWAGVRYTESKVVPASFEALAGAAVEDYQRNLPRDLETGDRDRASQWLAPRLGFRSTVPALPLQLTGVSVTNFGSHAAGRYQFQDAAGRNVTMVAYDGAGVPELPGPSLDADLAAAHSAEVRDLHKARSHGYPVVQWRKDGIVYILTGDLDEQDIPKVIQSLAK